LFSLTRRLGNAIAEAIPPGSEPRKPVDYGPQKIANAKTAVYYRISKAASVSRCCDMSKLIDDLFRGHTTLERIPMQDAEVYYLRELFLAQTAEAVM